ncbi:hypothetical protein LGH83_10165 [Lichenihabitans sp. PAMC28606]|uniref:hypothetical protein n=1 Tax=Lichenihabitans sp. PAMC28606 TaxID=2880932 RepID=UPI001D0BDA37|nr:hypothetical protein [Lichenihabitans sp. PAMC28606]UDL93002.1 hypothetical protein LGH83_10165 [Lichenihabitans sp. PAMC28606]
MSLAEFFTAAWADRWPGLVPNAPSRGLTNWSSPPADASYDLYIVEFDDQGRPFEPQAIDRIIDRIDLTTRDSDPLIIVFVHGWKHSAADSDENMESFKRLLHASAHIEQLRAVPGARPRRIVGVYVGWRGLTFHWLQIAQNFTFFGRSEGALRVALGSVRELFGRLSHIRNRSIATHSGARLVLAGHSFGGLIVYSAVAEYLIGSLAAADSATELVKPFGDLVLLINPAFEAARYLPVHAMLQGRTFAPGQQPVFMSITASNDLATGMAFPAGRLFWPYKGASTNALERQARVNTMGHVPWMRTHVVSMGTVQHPKAGNGQGRFADLPTLDDDDRSRLLSAEDAAFRAFRDRYTGPDGRLVAGWTRTYSAGAVLRQTGPSDIGPPDPESGGSAPDNPFWVIEASPEIVDGHNGIFKMVFLDFLRQAFDDTIRAQTPGETR